MAGYKAGSQSEDMTMLTVIPCLLKWDLTWQYLSNLDLNSWLLLLRYSIVKFYVSLQRFVTGSLIG